MLNCKYVHIDNGWICSRNCFLEFHDFCQTKPQSHWLREYTEIVSNINVSISSSAFYGNVVFHVNNSLDIFKQSLYIPCYGFLRQAEQFQGNLQGRLSILVTTQVVFTGCSLIYIQFVSSTKSGNAMTWKLFCFILCVCLLFF